MAGALARTCYAHLQTWRPYTMWYPGLVGLAGAAMASATAGTTAGTTAEYPRLFVAWAAPTLGWVSGHYLGDYFDRHLDAIGKPQRPIPSGRLSPRAARWAGLACAATLGWVCLLANWQALVVVVAAMGGIVAYSRVYKARGFSGNAVRGMLTALAYTFGGMMTQPLPPVRMLPFALVLWVHDTASNLVGTVRDTDSDRAAGYRTVPARHGVRTAVRISVLLYLLTVVVAAAGGWLVPRPVPDYLVLLAVAVLVGACAFGLLLRAGPSLAPRTALRAHEVLVVERLVLASALLAGAAGLLPAVAVLLPALAVSVLTQATMRSRYEFPPDPPGGLPQGPQGKGVPPCAPPSWTA